MLVVIEKTHPSTDASFAWNLDSTLDFLLVALQNRQRKALKWAHLMPSINELFPVD